MTVRATAVEGAALPETWLGALVVPDWDAAEVPPERPIRFRKTFTVSGEVAAAELFITACGVFDVELDGEPVGDHVLAPGWTSYRDRHRVVRHDLRDRLTSGVHVLGVTVAEGWYRGRLGFTGGMRQPYGSEIGPLVHLVLQGVDGSAEVVATDPSWRAAVGPIRAASLYDGESIDLRDPEPGWCLPAFDDGGWSPVRVAPFDPEVLFLASSPPVRRIEEVAPVSIGRSPSGAVIVDFGQNLAGRLRVRVPADPGRVITFRHAEVLVEGEPAYELLRGALATDEVVCTARVVEWEPAFTIHGFRYAEVDGWPGEPTLDDLRAIACHTDLTEIGRFACSDPLLEQLHENVRWGAKGNFVDVPTDCPQRDERLGWTGDLQVFGPTAAFLFDCESMLDSWLHDLAADQEHYGTVPPWVPFFELPRAPVVPIAGWGDAAVIVPWTLYEHFGDTELLRRHLPSMRCWVDQIADLAGPTHLWDRGLQLGDWLDPTAPPEQPGKGRTDAKLVACAYHAHTAALLARACAAVGDADGHERYAQLAADVRVAFAAEFITPAGRVVSESPAAYAITLRFDLFPTEAQREHAGRRLQHLVHLDGHHIGTGFLGTPVLLDALVDSGAPDDAYHLLLQTECPSWLYPITQGATTMWERWDAVLPDGSVNHPGMTSLNHYAFGAVADFLHRRVAGLGPLEPGYRTFAVRPLPGGGLTYAEASRQLPGGRAQVRWDRVGEVLQVQVEVPEGSAARVELPDGSAPVELGPGDHRLECPVRAAVDDPPLPVPLDRHGLPTPTPDEPASA